MYGIYLHYPLTLTDSGAFTAYFGVKRTVESSLVVFSLPTTAALMVYSLEKRPKQAE